MFTLLLRNIRGHVVRFLLTGLAIILGVTFLSGSFVITDTIRVSFEDLFTQLTAGTDAVVQGPLTPGQFSGPGSADRRGAIAESLLPTVRSVDGVAAAEGALQSLDSQEIILISSSGKRIGGETTSPRGASWIANSEFSPWTIVDGRPPRTDDELVVDVASARDGKLTIGSEVLVNAAPNPAKRYSLVGVARFGRVDRPIGQTAALFTMTEMQRLTRQPSQVAQILVQARDGISAEQLRARLRDALRTANVNVVTGDQFRKQQEDQLRKVLRFVYIGLFVFGGIGLLVGGFIIFNTFTVILAQRTRELALLRAIGAAPRQVLVSVLGEALAVGLVASALGVLSGIGLAAGLRAVLDLFDVSLPAGSLVIDVRTVVLGVGVGTAVTMLAAAVPAMRTSKVRPIEALRESAIEQRLPTARRLSVGLVVAALGVVGIVTGLFAKFDNNVSVAAGGAIVLFAGVFILSPLLMRPAARLLGALPARWRGVPGRLARDNAYRNPRRSAWTAIALTLGVAIVSLVTIVTASFKSSISAALDNQLGTTDYFISGSLSTDVTKRIASVDGVDAAIGIGFAEPVLLLPDGSRLKDAGFVLAVDPATIGRFVELGNTDGSITAIAGNGVGIPRALADKHQLRIGSPILARFSRAPVNLEVAAIFERKVFDRPALLIDHALYERAADLPVDFFSLAIADADQDTTRGAEAIRKALKRDYPATKVANFAEFKADQERQIDQVLFLFYGLLLLSIVIAFIGIVNTLALSVHERRHEIGLLRAVGTSQRQVRSAVRWESVIVAVFGAALGLGLGLVMGAILVWSLRSQDFVTRINFAPNRLAAIALAAGVAGVIAAVVPARRAARLNVLDAIRTE